MGRPPTPDCAADRAAESTATVGLAEACGDAREITPKLAAIPTVPRTPVRRRLLTTLEAGLQWSGAGALYVWARRVQGATILMYHTVAEAANAAWIDPCNHVPPELFERQMRLLARRRRVISMTALIEALQAGRPLAAGTVVLTFDDGYLDNLTVAAPILQRYGLPATLYLATGYVTRAAPQWIDQLYAMMRARTRPPLSLYDGPADGFDLRDPRRCADAYRAAAGRLLVAGANERERLLADIKDQLRPATHPPRLTMSWDEVRELRRRCPEFEVGVHTREHLDLATHGPETARRELEASIDDVQRELGERPVHFSFPYSRSTAETRRLVAEVGLRSAVATGAGGLVRAGADSFALPRVEPPAPAALLRFVTSGAWPDLPRALIGRA